jgi:hypothetical protein
LATLRREFDERNASTHPFGLARVDAFGIILNEVLDRALGVPANNRKPNAPVSFPFLWDTPQHEFVQWNGVAPNRPLKTHIVGPLSRNVGEVLGVFGEYSIPPGGGDLDGYPSSVRRMNLILTELLLKKLTSPKWPEEFPSIKQEKAIAGEKIYRRECASCHAILEDKTSLNRSIGEQFTPASEVGTDRQMAEGFANRRADPGPLTGRKRLLVAGTRFSNSEPASEVLVHVIAGTIVKRPLEPFGPKELVQFNKVLGGSEIHDLAKADVDEIRSDVLTDPSGLLKKLADLYELPPQSKVPSYKARPLNGIWATAPFLHNGSVPNLAQLLLPPKDRVDHFYVGSREFDPVNVGFASEKSFSGAFEFRVNDEAGKPIPGNSNGGHVYGTTLSPEERLQLIEYLKTL